MKNIQIISKSILTILGLGFLLSSCQARLDELRENPNAINEVDDASLFASGARALFLETAEESVNRFSGHHAHYFVVSGDVRKPDLYGDGFDTYYEDMLYVIYGGISNEGVIKNIEEVLQITTTEGTKNEVRYAMADVIGVMGFAVLTDEFGEIPYTEGGKGKTENILTPKYDTQEFIYTDLINRLTADIEVLKTLNADNGYFKTDFIYNSDSDKWVRFANSVRLRLAMRIRNANEDLSRATVIKCLQEPLMEYPIHDAFMIQTESDKIAWNELKGDGEPLLKVSDMYVNMMSNTNDPRLHVFVAKDNSGGYSGQLNGLTDEEFGKSNIKERSAMGDVLTQEYSKLYIMTAAETWLLRAEAALAYGTGENANDNYRAGIRTSMEQWDVAETDIVDFLATSIADLSDPMNDEEQIGNQLWLALTPDYFQGWCSIRRTGYPKIAQRTDPKLDKGVTDGYVPERFKYSSFELSTNGTNTEEAISRQGPNLITTPLWWSKKNNN